MVLLCSNCHSTPASLCLKCIDKNVLIPYSQSSSDQTASHKRHARRATQLLTDGTGALDEVRLLEAEIARLEGNCDVMESETSRVENETKQVASQITHHLESLPVRRANLLRRPLRLHSPPPPTIRPALWAIRQKRMVELLDVFDVRPADEEEGEEDEDWVIGGGLVLPGRRQDLDALPVDQTSAALSHTVHLLHHLAALLSLQLPYPPRIHPPALLPPPFLTSPPYPHSSTAQPTIHPLTTNAPPTTLLTSLAHLQFNVAQLAAHCGVPLDSADSATRVLANLARAAEDGNGETKPSGVTLEDLLAHHGLGAGGKSGADKDEGGNQREKRREGETREERRERRKRREEKKAGKESKRAGEKEKEKEGVDEWEIIVEEGTGT